MADCLTASAYGPTETHASPGFHESTNHFHSVRRVVPLQPVADVLSWLAGAAALPVAGELELGKILTSRANPRSNWHRIRRLRRVERRPTWVTRQIRPRVSTSAISRIQLIVQECVVNFRSLAANWRKDTIRETNSVVAGLSAASARQVVRSAASNALLDYGEYLCCPTCPDLSSNREVLSLIVLRHNAEIPTKRSSEIATKFLQQG